MEVENSSCCAVFESFFVISFCYNSEEEALYAERRLDNVRNVTLVGFLIEICQILT